MTVVNVLEATFPIFLCVIIELSSRSSEDSNIKQ